MRRLLPFVATLLVFSITPLGAELTEHLLHLVTRGQLAHTGHDRDHAAEGSEHGCSGPFHLCACHRTQTFVVTPSGTLRHDVTQGAPRSTPQREPAEGHLQRVFRPPRPA